MLCLSEVVWIGALFYGTVRTVEFVRPDLGGMPLVFGPPTAYDVFAVRGKERV